MSENPPRPKKTNEDALIEAIGSLAAAEVRNAARSEKEAKRREAAEEVQRQDKANERDTDPAHHEKLYAQTAERHLREREAHAAARQALLDRLPKSKDAILPKRRIEAIRSRLGELESAATSKNVEAEALALEEELRTIERALQSRKRAAAPERAEESAVAEIPRGDAIVSPETDKAVASSFDQLRAAVSKDAATASQEEGYAGDAHYPVPAVIETRREKKDALRAAVATADVISLPDESLFVGPIAPKPLSEMQQRYAGIQDMEADYLAKLKDFHKNRSALGRVGEAFIGEQVPAELKRLEERWQNERALYLANTVGTVESRLAERRSKREEGKAFVDAEKVRERYQQRYGFLKDMVLDPEAKKIEARKAGLDERTRGALDKAFERYRKLPPAVRILGTSALVFGAGAAITGGAIGLVPLMLGSTAAALRVAAEMQKNAGAKKGIGAASRAFSIGGVIGLAGEYAVKYGHQLAGTEKKAEAVLGKTGFGNLGNLNVFKGLLKEREIARKAKQTIELQSRWARMLASASAGVVAGHVAHDFMQGSTETVTSDQVDASAKGHITIEDSKEHLSDAHPAEAPDAAPAPSPETAAASVTDATPAPEGLRGATIHTPGQGMGELFVDLRHQLNADAAAIPHPSPALAHVLGENPNALTHEILAAKGGESIEMHMGDQLLVDKNQNVWFQAKGAELRLLYENDPTAPGGFKVHTLEDLHMQPDVHHEAQSGTDPQNNAPDVHAKEVSGTILETTHSEPVGIDQVTAAASVTDPGKLTHAPAETHLDQAPKEGSAVDTQVGPVEPSVEAPHAAEAQQAAPATEAPVEGNVNAHGAHLEKSSLLLDADKHRFAHVPRTGDIAADSEARYQFANTEAMKQPGKPIYFVSETQTALGTVERSVRAVYFDPERAGFPLPYSVDGSGAEYIMPKVPADSDLYPTLPKK